MQLGLWEDLGCEIWGDKRVRSSLTASPAGPLELQRAESLQEKTVKEAKTKCRTIASLLTAAPNPHSKGVLMFKKRRQRAKKYTLVSFGAAEAGPRRDDEEDCVPPTSESELDEEAFSDARSLSNPADWDSPYLDMEPVDSSQGARGGGGGDGGSGCGQLSEASGRGLQLFEQQRQRAASTSDSPEHPQVWERSATVPAACNGQQALLTPPRARSAPPDTPVLPPSPSLVGSPFPASSIFNRSARPFTPGLQGQQRPVATSVVFRPQAPKRANENLGDPVQPPFLPASPWPSSSPGVPGPARAPTATSSLYIPAPSRPVTPGGAAEPPGPPGATAWTSTSTARIVLSAPPRPAVAPEPDRAPEAGPSAREQRISVPAARTGILQEARRRGTRKQMFRPGHEDPKHSPNPELLSLVQNLDGKSRAGGAESGPEEDALSLGAEACNFLQGKSPAVPPLGSPQAPPPAPPKTPPPVAPKPPARAFLDGLVNGAATAASSAGILETPKLQGRGAELFARRQSRADRYVVDVAPSSGRGPRPRSPSPTPSLPPSWKYSPNIRAPPPIAYNPLLSPFFPQASRTLPSKGPARGAPAATPKPGIKALDFLRHQPYQLKTAMFCFDEAPSSPGPGSSGPPKTARVQEIRRFSTPAPQPTAEPLAPTVLAPRAATTLDEPIWRAELASLPALSPDLPAEAPRSIGATPSSCAFQVARPRFSVTRTGLQAQVWRPGAGHH